jgi:hypothetical protein
VVIFVNEERAYLSWLAHHRHGFVLDMLKHPTRKQPILHRASCDDIKAARSKKTHWTTGRHVKACALDMDELLGWMATESDSQPVYCDKCKPTDETHSLIGPHEKHLTKLGKDIVDYVVEAAVVCLDQGAEYDASVADVAAYLGKTPAQITAALLRLVDVGYLRIEGEFDARNDLPGQRLIFPTADALRTLPAFEQMTVGKVKAELEHLTDKEDQ